MAHDHQEPHLRRQSSSPLVRFREFAPKLAGRLARMAAGRQSSVELRALSAPLAHLEGGQAAEGERS